MSVSTKPASGTRDFLPAAVAARRAVVGVVQRVYESYGFVPIETPAFERLEVLTSKYGDEGDQLIFRILKRRDALPALTPELRPDDLTDLALRYDLTVPLARVVAANFASLPKFFKRYQVQTVWRADRPQRGRFREFYQCDVDYTGTTSLIAEHTVIAAASEALASLGFSAFEIRLNDRRVLTGALELCGISPALHGATLTAVDKLDKVGISGVRDELAALGLGESTIDALAATLLGGGGRARLDELAARFADGSPTGAAGAKTLQDLFAMIDAAPVSGSVEFDPTLARGLSYYTGPIFEIRVPDLAGSIGGGGRYDGLIGMFRGSPVPAVGFSLGLERILVIMEERGMLPSEPTAAEVVVAVADEGLQSLALRHAAAVRAAGLRAEVYPELTKLGKQLSYAESVGAQWVIIVGKREADAGVVALKNMATGDQSVYPLGDAVAAMLAAHPTAAT
ncbi:MAG: histidine--tRNA ligase [Myxococcales bacterium]|nr:histidine--tRNA ligase [Myxococcales bacterium]MCB9530979.1 histidine--tRNA ligase [Myxococcales bacterium]